MKQILSIFLALLIWANTKAQTKEELVLQQFHSGYTIHDFDIDSSGTKLVSVGDDKNILFYDLQTRLIYNRIKLQENTTCKHLSIDSKHSKLITLENGNIIQRDLINAEIKKTISLKNIIDSLKLYSFDKDFLVIDEKTNTLLVVAYARDEFFTETDAFFLIFNLNDGKLRKVTSAFPAAIEGNRINSIGIKDDYIFILTSLNGLVKFSIKDNSSKAIWQLKEKGDVAASFQIAGDYSWVLSNKNLELLDLSSGQTIKAFPQDLGTNSILMRNHPFAADNAGNAYLFNARTEKAEVYSSAGKSEMNNASKAYLPSKLKTVNSKKYLAFADDSKLLILDYSNHATLLDLTSTTSNISNWRFYKPGIAYAVDKKKEAFLQADFTRGYITRQNFADGDFYYQEELIDLPKSKLKVASNGLYIKFLDAENNRFIYGISVPLQKITTVDDVKLNFGSSLGATNILFTEDEKLMVTPKNQQCAVLVWDIANKKLLREINLKPKNKPDEGKKQIIKYLVLHDKENLLYVETEDNYAGNNEAIVIDIVSGKILMQENTKFSAGIKSSFFPVQRKVFFPGALYGETRILDVDKKAFDILPFEVNNPQISTDEQTVYFISGNNVCSYHFPTKTNKIIGEQTQLEGLVLDRKSNLLLSYSSDNTNKIWDADKGILTCDFYVNIPESNEEDPSYMFVSPENYYMGGGNYAQFVALKKDGFMLPFEQFDRIYNRPDKLLAALGKSNAELINRLAKISAKRGGKNNNNFTQGFHAQILNKSKYPLAVSGTELSLEMNALGSKSALTNYQLWINGVPLFNGNGKAAKPNSSNTWSETIKLTDKINRIELAFWNAEAKESTHDLLIVEAKNSTKKPVLWLVSIGASEYKQTDYNLKYAGKDADDLANSFQETNAFQKINTLVLKNEYVSKTGFQQIKDFLATSAEEDVILIFYAGHGLLDDKLNYFLASHDMDFNNPALNGLAIEDFENILVSATARKKLLIIDACHSGLLEEQENIIPGAQKEDVNNTKLTGRGIQVNKNQNNAIDAELLQSIFLSTNNGQGITIIAAAGGAELAYEDPQYKNGLFTYTFLEGVKTGKADLNKDNEIAISEIKKYVERRVLELSQGKQRPTNRRWNSYSDFYIWKK